MRSKLLKLFTLFQSRTFSRTLIDHQWKYLNQKSKPAVSFIPDFQIRNANVEDIDRILETRREYGNPDCKSCLKTWLKLDPKGIYIAEDVSGDIVGTISAIIYPDELVNMGLLYIKEKYRNYGLREKLMNLMNQHTGDRLLIGHARKFMYEKYFPENKTLVLEDYTCMKNITTQKVDSGVLSGDLPEGVTIHPFHESHLESICAYDFSVMGHERNLLMELNCHEENSNTYVAFQNGVCVGFGTIKLCVFGFGRVGPLYANSGRIAEPLLKALLESFPKSEGFAMNTLSNNQFANDLVKKLFKVTPNSKHLYLISSGTNRADVKNVFAIFDPNLVLF